MDINFEREVSGTDVVYLTARDPRAAFGNKKLANIFEINFLTQSRRNDVFGARGGNALSILGAHYSTSDLQSMAALITTMIDATVNQMKEDQEAINVPPTERILDAKLTHLVGSGKYIYVNIHMIPEERNTEDQILTFFL